MALFPSGSEKADVNMLRIFVENFGLIKEKIFFERAVDFFGLDWSKFKYAISDPEQLQMVLTERAKRGLPILKIKTKE
jgi:hypothetical protein